jgi:hypothetical protein
LAHDRGNQRRQQIFCKRSDDARERGTDYHTYSHVYHVSAQDEFLESV